MSLGRKLKHVCRWKIFIVLPSIALGFMLASWLSDHHTMYQNCDQKMIAPVSPSSPNKFIYIGVMTAEKHLATRAVAVNRTWARSIPGQVNFYSSASFDLYPELNLPIIRLQGVSESYPPQQKSFMMLKHMHDNFIDKFEWFMRADDDVYVRGERLEKFLRSVNSSKSQFIGSAGTGPKEEDGLLNLDTGDNYCIGGPGIIFSRETLRKVGPHISYCLKNLWSAHEDVEVGRCVKKFAKIDCTRAYEMQTLFYQDYTYRTSKSAFMGRLDTAGVHNAITLHPIKKASYMYRLHNYLQSVKIMDLQMKTMQLYRHISEMKQLLNEDENDDRMSGETDPQLPSLGQQPGLLKYAPCNHKDSIAWNFFNNRWYSVARYKKTIPTYQMDALDNVARQTVAIINANSVKGTRTIDFKSIRYGYTRVVPLFGADYMLDFNAFYRKHGGKEISVRRQAYLQQSFGKIEMRIDNEFEHARGSSSDHSGANKLKSGITDSSFGTRRANKVTDSSRQQHRQINKETVNLILPLAGRPDIFRRFMERFESVCLAPGENVKIIIVLFKLRKNDTSREIEKLFAEYTSKYSESEMTLVHAKGRFSRGIALNIGASRLPADALLFIVDVDMYISPGFLTRCRLNTRQGKQIYYPVMFSQYSPEVTYGPGIKPESKLDIDKENGFFRTYSYGMVCLYKSDLARVGGLETKIIGWGLEDQNLYQKLFSGNLTILRTPDPELFHVYHPVMCDSHLKARQYRMCMDSKINQYGRSWHLVRIIEKEKLHYNDTLDDLKTFENRTYGVTELIE